MSRHTFGEWRTIRRAAASDNSHGFNIVAPAHPIAHVFPVDPGGEEGLANAHVIAAAPDTTALLQELVDSVAGGGNVVTITDEKLAEYRAVLAKAKGETP